MPQTYQSPVRVYKHPFELVMMAYHKRFPTCPQIPIFVGSDIIYEYHSADDAEEIVERKCTLNVDAPYILKKVAGIDYVYFMQRNHLNKRDRTLSIEASNISFSNRIAIVENCRYYVHADNEDWTCFEQSASLDVKSFFGFESTVEKLAVKQYAANIAKGKEILEFFIQDLLKDGVVEVPRWSLSVGQVPPAAGAIEHHHQSGVLGTSDDVQAFLQQQKFAEQHRSPSDSAIGDGGSSQHEDELDGESNKPPGPSSEMEVARRTSSPLSGTAEERMALDELNRRRSGSVSASSQQHKKSLIIGGGGATAAAAVSSRTKSVVEDELTSSKLETEYIQRFLGQLTPLEESRLCELKYGLQSTHKGKLPNDAHLLRFLRARDFDVQKASQMLLASLLWRKQHNVDKILQEFEPPPVLVKYLPAAWHHADIEGRPLYVLCLGKTDIKGLLRTVGLEAMVKYTLSICEQGLLRAAEATRHHGKPILTMSLLIDLEGLSLRHLWRPGIQCLLRIIETVEAHYPETLGRVLCTRAPRVFPVLWTLISPFIDENTTRKFVFNTERLVLDELERYLPRATTPDFLGGPASFQSPAGHSPGHVPKSQYLPLNEVIRENEDILKSLYNTASVTRGIPQECCVWIADKGAVLTWDFDIIKGDCEFTVYYTQSKIKQSTTAGHHQSSEEFPGVLLTVAAEAMDRVTTEVANLLLPGNAHMPATPLYQVVAVAPELTFSKELSVVHATTMFGEGDSMQGSYYCERVGTYILQWRHPADGNKPSGTTPTQSAPAATVAAFAASKTSSSNVAPSAALGASSDAAAHGGVANKCRLLYFHDVLDSDGFRGSVASLASCRESFSSLAELGVGGSSASPNPRRQQPMQQQKAYNTHNTTAADAICVGQQNQEPSALSASSQPSTSAGGGRASSSSVQNAGSSSKS